MELKPEPDFDVNVAETNVETFGDNNEPTEELFDTQLMLSQAEDSTSFQSKITKIIERIQESDPDDARFFLNFEDTYELDYQNSHNLISNFTLLDNIIKSRVKINEVILEDLFFAVLFFPVVGFVAASQQLVMVNTIKKISKWWFVLISSSVLALRTYSIIQKNRERLLLYHKADFYLNVFQDNLTYFTEFTYSDVYISVVNSEDGVNDILNLNIIQIFYDWKAKYTQQAQQFI